MTGTVPPDDSPEYEDEIDRILREKHKFRRLSEAEAAQLFEEEIERLEDEYDVARAREIRKAVREGRMELVGGQELVWCPVNSCDKLRWIFVVGKAR